MKNIKEKLKNKINLPAITRKYHSLYRKRRYEIVEKPKEQPSRIYLEAKLALTVIKDCKTPASAKFKRKLKFNASDVFITWQQTRLGAIIGVFGGVKIRKHNFLC